MIIDLKTQLVTAISNSPIVYIPHFDYKLVDLTICDILTVEYGEHRLLDIKVEDIVEFDLNRGVIDFNSKLIMKKYDQLSKLETFLKCLVEWSRFDHERIFIFKNFSSVWGKTDIISYLQAFVNRYESGFYNPLCTIIIESADPYIEIPAPLEKITSVIEISTPDEQEIEAAVRQYEISPEYVTDWEKDEVVTEMCRTLQGLHLYEVMQILKLSTKRTGTMLSHTTISIATEEKKQIVKKSGIVEVVDADVKFDEVGGLDNLRKHIQLQQKIFNNLNLAIKCNLPIPKGILILGMPGCGKSMIAKSIANYFNMSLLRLDVNRLMGKYVGQSEGNLRKALATAESAHPCVLWIDEIEKAFAGSNNSSGDNDMLVMRLMGHFLTWMQERKTPVYVVATANDVMRPEFMRKGRFDEVFFVNFPNKKERQEIFYKKLERYKKSKADIFDFSKLGDLGSIFDNMQVDGHGFSGAEIEHLIQQVMNECFIQYVNNLEKDKSSKPIEVSKKKFEDAILQMKPTVMANQIRRDRKNRLDLTNIERILNTQEIYKFTFASSKMENDKNK